MAATRQFGCRFGLAMMLIGLAGSVAGSQSIDEYHVKAAFLYNFLKFVDWPPEVFKNPQDSFSICVLGNDPFGQTLIDAVSGKEVGGREISVRAVPDVQHSSRCQILFVSASERKLLATIVRETRASCILTVGESDNFTAMGGVIGFTLTGGRVRFEINLGAADDQGLRISSKLLSLAHIVKSRKGRAR